VVEAFAVIQADYPRLTGDIDLLVDTSLENERLVYQALRSLPDKAVDQLEAGDIEKFTVVRVADEVLVDLMRSGCGVDYCTAVKDAVFHEIDGVRIPFASPLTLWRMKQTHRAKDGPDRLFLRQLLEEQAVRLDPPTSTQAQPLPWLHRWLNRLFGLAN
jgi:hypothetical protein